MTHAERPGAEAGDRAAGLERRARGLGAVEYFEPIAERIGEHDEILDAAFIRERARAAGNLDPGLLQSRGKIIERGGVGHLPAEESDPLAAVFAYDHALLAVVHPQRQTLAAALDELHPEELGAEARPVLERFCTNADIAETLNIHGAASVSSILRGNMGFLDDLGKFREVGLEPLLERVDRAGDGFVAGDT